MEKRKIGQSTLTTAPLIFGGNVFGWTITEPESFKLLDAFTEAGFNMIDTADVYSRWVPGNAGGESETIIGNWMKERKNRDQVIIATKVGHDMGQGQKDISQAYILKAVEDSLRRLQTDYIDLYQTHYDVPGTPVEETLSAYDQLIKDGKVRVIGASNYTPERLREALKVSAGKKLPHYESLQPLYNLYDREDFEKELQPLCKEAQISVIPYYALASGFLSGKYRTEADLVKSPRGKKAKQYLNDRGKRILKALDQVANDYNTTPASISIAWLIAQPTIAAAIASATNTDQLEQLINAVQLKLDNKALELLSDASAY